MEIKPAAVLDGYGGGSLHWSIVMADSSPKYFTFERTVGGDGCELGVVCVPAETEGQAHPDEAQRGPYYALNKDLPDDIRIQLPDAVQTLFRQAYNRAWDRHFMPVVKNIGQRHDEVARRAAWGAVRRLYVQHGTTWVRRKKD